MSHTRWPMAGVLSPRSDGGKSGELMTRKTHVLFAAFLTVLAAIAGFLQYFGNPIDCWCPVEFSSEMVSYANSVCFFNNQYYLPFTPFGPQTKESLTNYYKQTPFGLLLLAALYIIPEILAHVTSGVFGLRLGNILQLAHQSTKGSKEKRQTAIDQLTFDLQYRLQDQDDSRQSGLRRLVNRLLPSLPLYIRLQHLTNKLVFLLGSLVPIIFLYETLQMNFSFYHHVADNNNSSGSNQTYFPSQILCDFEIRRFGNLIRYSVGCHLQANDMYERMAVLVGFLALVVSSISSSDFIVFLVTHSFKPNTALHYTNTHLKRFADSSSIYDQDLLQEFTERYLRADGMYLIQLIGQNSSEAVVSLILITLWDDYKENLFKKKISSPPPYVIVTDMK